MKTSFDDNGCPAAIKPLLLSVDSSVPRKGGIRGVTLMY